MTKIKLSCRILDKTSNVSENKSKSIQFDTEELEGLSVEESMKQGFAVITAMVKEEMKENYKVKQTSLTDHE